MRKPECIDSYNKHMGAVDKTDMQISSAECTRKTRKWYNTKMQFVEFRTNVAEQLLALHRP